MSKFRKKPIVIDAIQWFENGDHPNDNSETLIHSETNEEFLSGGKVVRRFRRPDVAGKTICKACDISFHQHGWIDIPGCGFIVCPGDWIITDIDGGYCPLKPDIFNATYEPVEDLDE